MQATWQALQPMHLDIVDELGHFARVCRTWGVAVVVAERCTDVERLHAAMASSSPFSMLTRNALNSGVCELASPTKGVSVLAR